MNNENILLDRESLIFRALVSKMSVLGLYKHEQVLIENAKYNKSKITRTIREIGSLEKKKAKSGIVICAGPSVYRKKLIQQIVESHYSGTTIAVDGSYVACLRAGLIPDYVVTLDPSPKRIVRWFGDPHLEENSKNDDYYKRQDLNIEFRKNSELENQKNINLVNHYGHLTKAIVSSSSPKNVVQRIEEAGFQTFWFNPLVDDPKKESSLTKRLYLINKLPCMNTGGTVGTAAWVFASAVLKLPRIALIGMDYGYYYDTPLSQTQTYYEFLLEAGSDEKIKDYFITYQFPLTGEKFYTDPTYYWYRKNFFELLKKPSCETFNSTGCVT